MITLIKSLFHFEIKGKQYALEFFDKEKVWKIYFGNENSDTHGTLPWNGIKNLPNAQDAEEVLAEYLGLD